MKGLGEYGRQKMDTPFRGLRPRKAEGSGQGREESHEGARRSAEAEHSQRPTGVSRKEAHSRATSLGGARHGLTAGDVASISHTPTLREMRSM